MNRIRSINPILRSRWIVEKQTALRIRRSYSSPPPSSNPQHQSPPIQQTPKQGTRAGAFYKSFGSPILKAFLGAVFTYQLLYWGWLKLESFEIQEEKEEEIKSWEQKLKTLVKSKEGPSKAE